MRKRILLVIWLIGIIFPMAWLGRFSSRYHNFFNALFSPEWVHWVMHAGLYTGLVILVICAFNLDSSGKTVVIALCVALGVGIVQESLQLLSGVQVLRWNTLLDLGVDSAGALAGYGLVWGVAKRREEKLSSRRER